MVCSTAFYLPNPHTQELPLMPQRARVVRTETVAGSACDPFGYHIAVRRQASLTGAGRPVSPRVNDRRERLGHQVDSVLGFVVSGGGDARRYREILARWPEPDRTTGAAQVFLADVLSQRDQSKADEEALGLLNRFLSAESPHRRTSAHAAIRRPVSRINGSGRVVSP